MGRRDDALLTLVTYSFFSQERMKEYPSILAKHIINVTSPLLWKHDISIQEIPDLLPFLHQYQADVAALETLDVISGSHSKRLIEYHFMEPCLGWEVSSAILYSGILDEESGEGLRVIIQEALDANLSAVKDILSGKEKAVGSILGYIMKRVKTDPSTLRAIILEEIHKTNDTTK